MKTRVKITRKDRGSLLLVAMLICGVIAIALSSYVQLANTAMKISNRALYMGGAMNLAENGLENAVYSLNKANGASYNWGGNGWTVTNGGADVRKGWSGYTLDQGVTGRVQAYVYNYATAVAPKIVSRSTVTLPNNGGTTEKWVLVQLRRTSKFANGLVAKNSIKFNGNNAYVDSWNSAKNDDGTLRSSIATYSDSVRHDNGSVGSISVSTNAVNVGNADIWGYASTGGALPSMGPNGTVGAFGTAQGTMDMTHVSTDFTADFKPVSAPTQIEDPTTSPTDPTHWVAPIYNTYTNAKNNAVIDGALKLPRIGTDQISADGKYYITLDSINFNNATLEIAGPVVLKLTNTASSVSISGGTGMLQIDTGAKLEMYAAGDVSIGGKGILNGGTDITTANQPAACQIYGTKTTGTQDIKIAGNGVLSAAVYAPQGSITITGNGDVLGSMVGNDVTVSGDAKFHYDESLADLGGNNPYRVSKWQELTSQSDRNTYASLFTGW